MEGGCEGNARAIYINFIRLSQKFKIRKRYSVRGKKQTEKSGERDIGWCMAVLSIISVLNVRMMG